MDTSKKNNPHSLRRRYFYKLFSNLLGIPVSLITQTIIPRGLGPQHYGDFNFLTSFFSQFIGFFDSGTSMGFYTKLSQRRNEPKLVSFYFYFILVIAFFLLLFVLALRTSGFYKVLLPGQSLGYVYLALFLGILGWAANIISQMTDAYGLTVSAEIMKALQKIAGLFILLYLFFARWFNLTNFFLYNYLMFLILAFFLLRTIKSSGYTFSGKCNLSLKEVKGYSKEFYEYSHPLFVYSLVGMVVGIFDRWILQLFGGSIQQGFYSLSAQIGVTCFLFVSAMTPLIMREFSIAHDNKDIKSMGELFSKHIPLLYSITAFFACFVAVNAHKVTLIIGGGKFKEAVIPVAIMAIFPIHQTYGQLGGSLYYATGRTRLYRNIGITFMLIGLPLTYILIAPVDKFGLHAGAVGLAIKMVALQIITVNVFLYFNTKFLGLSFSRFLKHQLFSVLFLFTASFFSSFCIDKLINQHVLISVIVNAIFYTLIVAWVIYFWPEIFGLKKNDRRRVYEKFIYYVQKKRFES